jgi:hypothetical protein
VWLRRCSAKRRSDLFGLLVAQKYVVSKWDRTGVRDRVTRVVGGLGEWGHGVNRHAPTPISAGSASGRPVDPLYEFVNLPVVHADATGLDPGRPRRFEYFCQPLDEDLRLGIYSRAPHKLSYRMRSTS